MIGILWIILIVCGVWSIFKKLVSLSVTILIFMALLAVVSNIL